MKERIAFGSLIFASLIALTLATPVMAGDDIVTNLTMSADAGAAVACTALLKLNTHYSAQPTVDTYIGTSPTNDGGAGLITSSNVLVGTNKLYDIWTTYDKPYICCKPAANGAASNCKIFQYREGTWQP